MFRDLPLTTLHFAESKNNKIWIVETIYYGTAFGGDYLRFELYDNGNLVSSLDFQGTELRTRFEREMARRKGNLSKNPGSGLTWEEVKRRARSRQED